MAAGINIFTADSKLRFPFPREVRSKRLLALFGPYFGAFFGLFFQYVFGPPQKRHLFAFLVFSGAFWGNFLQILRSFWALLGHLLKNSGFLKIVVFPRKNKGFQGLGLPKIEANLTNKWENIWRAGNIWPKRLLNPLFHKKCKLLVDFGVHFGSILGSKIASKMDPLQNKEDFGSPGGPQGASGVILGQFWEAFGGLWAPFWGLCGSFWGYFWGPAATKEAKRSTPNKSAINNSPSCSKQQEIWANISKKQQILGTSSN